MDKVEFEIVDSDTWMEGMVRQQELYRKKLNKKFDKYTQWKEQQVERSKTTWKAYYKDRKEKKKSG